MSVPFDLRQFFTNKNATKSSLNNAITSSIDDLLQQIFDHFPVNDPQMLLQLVERKDAAKQKLTDELYQTIDELTGFTLDHLIPCKSRTSTEIKPKPKIETIQLSDDDDNEIQIIEPESDAQDAQSGDPSSTSSSRERSTTSERHSKRFRHASSSEYSERSRHHSSSSNFFEPICQYVTVISYKCSVANCEEKLQTEVDLRNHMASEHILLPFYCLAEGCKKSFSERQQMAEHMNYVHKQRNNWPCNKCPFIGWTPVSAFNHQYLRHQEGEFKCSKGCDKVYELPGDAFEHYHRRH